MKEVLVFMMVSILYFGVKAQDTDTLGVEVEKRQPILSFSCQDSTGKLVSISDFKGKVVYMDVWATWCLPCRRQVPKLKDLKEQFHSDSLVYLYVSLDYKFDKWKKFVERKEMDGVHLIANEFFHKDFSEKYGIYAIPHFILIDKQGRVYKNDAPRPGWPEIEADLEKLLQETDQLE